MKRHQDNPYVAAGFGREFLWLDLANTLEWNGFGKLTDHLHDPTWLGLMLQHWGIASQIPQPVPQGEIVALRVLLRRLSEKLMRGKQLDAHDLAALNSYLNAPAHIKLVQRQNGGRTLAHGTKGNRAVVAELVPDQPGWPWILSRFAASFAEMLSLDRLDRLKFCPNQGCKWVFYDQTKGNTRRWCNERTCGNRDRVRRARAKKKPPRRRLKS